MPLLCLTKPHRRTNTPRTQALLLLVNMSVDGKQFWAQTVGNNDSWAACEYTSRQVFNTAPALSDSLTKICPWSLHRKPLLCSVLHVCKRTNTNIVTHWLKSLHKLSSGAVCKRTEAKIIWVYTKQWQTACIQTNRKNKTKSTTSSRVENTPCSTFYFETFCVIVLLIFISIPTLTNNSQTHTHHPL